MKLKSNSISSKLYRWFYGTDSLPTNLCPYFWKLVLAWVVLIPYSLVCLPMILTEIYDKEYKYTDNSTGKRIGLGVIVYFMLLAITSMISLICAFFVSPEKNGLYGLLASFGAMVWVIAIVIGVIGGTIAFKEWNDRRKIKYDEYGRRIWNQPKEEKTYLIIEFTKAKYNKYCPKIDWIDTNKF